MSGISSLSGIFGFILEKNKSIQSSDNSADFVNKLSISGLFCSQLLTKSDYFRN